MRLVHAADLHLDSPLRGLSRLGDDSVAATLRAASRRALENLVRLVIEERVPLLLLAGDVYDGNWHDYGTGRFFVQQMGRLHDVGVRVVMVSGNHDAESEITRSLRLPPNVTALGVNAPQSVRLDDLGVVVHGQGYVTKAVLHNLAAEYPDRDPGSINIGLLHTSVDGQEGHERYAPCSLTDLLAKGYEYFALGHVHRRGVLHEGEHTVAYSGNLQGRHPREAGPKGALLVDLEPAGSAGVDFRELDAVRWELVTVPLEGCADLDDALKTTEEALRTAATTAHGRSVVVRVTLVGRTAAAADLADADRVREEIGLIGCRTGVTVEKIGFEVKPVDEAEPVDAGLFDAIRSAVAERCDDPRALKEELRGLDREVGRLLREAGLVDVGDPQTLSRILSRAADRLEAQLTGGAR
jgi:exonuclease SbcD